MNIQISEFNVEDRERLVDFLSSGYWEFYREPHLKPEAVNEKIEKGHYTRNGVTFWIKDDSGAEIGMMRLFDLGEDIESSETPLFDIRIKSSRRGKGAGTEAVKWLIAYVFNTYPNKTRFEATTRIDNLVMRRVLEKCGFVKEAHYRQSWPGADGKNYDSAGYAILKEDWMDGTISPVKWEL